MKQIIGRKIYDTEKAMEIASDRYWDGNNWERNGRNQTLYKTQNGNFFICNTTQWQGERDTIQPVSKEEAMELYESLPEHAVEYKETFDVEPEEA